MLANALNLFDSNCKQTAILEICRGRKNKWAIAPELQNRSLWASFKSVRYLKGCQYGVERCQSSLCPEFWCRMVANHCCDLCTYMNWNRRNLTRTTPPRGRAHGPRDVATRGQRLAALLGRRRPAEAPRAGPHERGSTGRLFTFCVMIHALARAQLHTLVSTSVVVIS